MNNSIRTYLNLTAQKSLKKGYENQHHLYVSEIKRNFETVRFEILESLKGFCLFRSQRISFQAKDNDLVIVHEKIACDLPLKDISGEHRDVVRLLGTKSLFLL